MVVYPKITPIISLCFKGLAPNGVIKSSGLSCSPRSTPKSIKEIVGRHTSQSLYVVSRVVRSHLLERKRKSSERRDSLDGRARCGRRKATASRGDNRVPSDGSSHPLYFPFFMTLHNPIEAPTAERGNARGSPSVESTSGANECARGRWYFQFHRAWVNEAHEGWREVRATTLRNFPTHRQN